MSDRTFTTEVQEPLVPAEVSFPSYLWVPLDINAITEGDLSFLSGEGFKAAIMLMMKSWQEKPATSLPDDDRKLAAYCGFGRDAAAQATFAAVKDQALSDFVMCSDGRYYSRTLAPQALDSWASRRAQVARTEKARQTKLDKQRREADPATSATGSVTESATGSATGSVTEAVTRSTLQDRTLQDRKSEGRVLEGRQAEAEYALVSGPIRLTEGELRQLIETYPSINVRSKLMAMGDWSNLQGPKGWRGPMIGNLTKAEDQRSREIMEARAKAEADAKVGLRKMDRPRAAI